MLLPAFSVALIGLIQGAGVSQGYSQPGRQVPERLAGLPGAGRRQHRHQLRRRHPGRRVDLRHGADHERRREIALGQHLRRRCSSPCIVLVAAPLVELVPMPALAALLIVAGFQGLRIQQAMTIWNTGKVTAVVMIMTFVATLFVPLQYAVLLGMAFSILLYVFRQSNKVMITQMGAAAGRVTAGTAGPQAVCPATSSPCCRSTAACSLPRPRTWRRCCRRSDQTSHAVVAIGLRGKSEIGSTFMTVLQRYAEALQAHDSKLMLVGVDPAVRDQLAKTGVLKLIGEENVFLATPQLGGR